MSSSDSIAINRAYLDSMVLEGRIIGAVHPDAGWTLFGKSFQTPVMTAALSHLSKVHPGGVPELARGAALAGAAAQIGMGGIDELKEAAAGNCGVIKVIKPNKDEKEIFSRIEAAEEAGALAIGMDLEHAVNTDDDLDSVVAGYPMELKSVSQIAAYVKASKLPFFVKGALSVSDALRARDLGVAGLILSHHNGLLRWAVPPVQVLPEIRKAVGSDLVLIIDGGIADGADAYKALALGADAVSVGKPLMGPLGESGAEGVAATINRITAELKGYMARTGVKDLKHMDPSVIHFRKA